MNYDQQRIFWRIIFIIIIFVPVVVISIFLGTFEAVGMIISYPSKRWFAWLLRNYKGLPEANAPPE